MLSAVLLIGVLAIVSMREALVRRPVLVLTTTGAFVRRDAFVPWCDVERIALRRRPSPAGESYELVVSVVGEEEPVEFDLHLLTMPWQLVVALVEARSGVTVTELRR